MGSYVAYPKRSSKRARISIDGVDVSNAFRSFNVQSAKSTQPAGGFNPTGVEETVPGAVTQSFVGELYSSATDVVDMLWDFHIADTVVEIQFQPEGLDDPTESVWYGNCTINETSPTETFGEVTTFPFSALPADSDGIQRADGT